MKYTPWQPKSNVNVTPTSHIWEFFVLAGGLMGLIVVVYLVLGLAVDLIVPHISIDLENKIGVYFFQSMDGKDADSQREYYVQSLIDDLQERCAKLPYRFKIHVRKASTVNAMALPGGHVIVFTGLLDTVSSENELAFVLAHEMGHYAHRDHLRAGGRAVVLMAFSALLFGADSSVSKVLGHTLNITELSFSRKQETQADEFALETINCAYDHVGGATDFFEKIPKEQDLGKFGHYFASHPENRRRISHLNNMIRSRGFNPAKRKPLPEAIWKSIP